MICGAIAALARAPLILDYRFLERRKAVRLGRGFI
jgi:hypothetical protein